MAASGNVWRGSAQGLEGEKVLTFWGDVDQRRASVRARRKFLSFR